MSARKRRALDRFLRADRSALPIPALFARGARELVRRRPETLGAEWMLGYAFSWRRLVGATAARPAAAGQARRPAPAGAPPGPRDRVPGDPDLRAIAEQVLPLRLAAADDAPERINLLVPALAAEPAPLHLARRLAERGARVRILTVNPAGALPALVAARPRRTRA